MYISYLVFAVMAASTFPDMTSFDRPTSPEDREKKEIQRIILFRRAFKADDTKTMNCYVKIKRTV